MGKEATADPNREISFGFVSCSCRACVRAGEAKLRERVGDVLLNAGGLNGNIDSSSPPAAGWPALAFVAIRVGFKQISSYC